MILFFLPFSVIVSVPAQNSHPTNCLAYASWRYALRRQFCVCVWGIEFLSSQLLSPCRHGKGDLGKDEYFVFFEDFVEESKN